MGRSFGLCNVDLWQSRGVAVQAHHLVTNLHRCLPRTSRECSRLAPSHKSLICPSRSGSPHACLICLPPQNPPPTSRSLHELGSQPMSLNFSGRSPKPLFKLQSPPCPTCPPCRQAASALLARELLRYDADLPEAALAQLSALEDVLLGDFLVHGSGGPINAIPVPGMNPCPMTSSTPSSLTVLPCRIGHITALASSTPLLLLGRTKAASGAKGCGR